MADDIGWGWLGYVGVYHYLRTYMGLPLYSLKEATDMQQRARRRAAGRSEAESLINDGCLAMLGGDDGDDTH